MANNNQLDILLRLVADLKGGELTRQEIERIKAASVSGSAAAAAATENYTGKLELAGKAKKMLLSQLGQLGALARFAFSPLSLAAAGVAMVIGKLKQDFENWKKQLEDMAESNAQALGPTADKLAEIKRKTIEANEAFKLYQDVVAEKSKQILADIEAQFNALEKILKAEEAVALARSADPEKTKEQFRALTASLGIEQKRQVLAEKQAELGDTIKRGGQAYERMQGSLGPTSPEAAKLSLQTLPDSIKAADALVKRYEAEQAALPQQITRDKTQASLFGYPILTKMERVANPAVAEMQQKIDATRRYKSGLEAEQNRLTTGLAAHGELETLGKQARGMSGETSRLGLDVRSEEVAELRRRIAAMEGEKQREGAALETAVAGGLGMAADRHGRAMDSITANIRKMAAIVEAKDKEIRDIMQTLAQRQATANTRP